MCLTMIVFHLWILGKLRKNWIVDELMYSMLLRVKKQLGGVGEDEEVNLA